MKQLLLVAMLLTAFALPASAHDRPALESWEADIIERMMEGVTPELMAEYQEVRISHAWYFDPQPITRTVRSQPAAQPSVQYVPTNVEQWRGLVAAYPGWDVDRMLRIMACESHGNPYAENPRSTATGLFQIMASVWYPNGPRSDLHDPAFNVATAYYVWQTQGYGAWVCRG